MQVYPANLLKELKAVWSIKRNQYETFSQLPSDKVLLELLEVVYHASFLTEESRRISVRILFSQLEIIKKKLNNPISNNRLSVLEFEQKRVFSKGEILRLAPATDPEKMLIGVEYDSKKGLLIWGLVDIGSSWWKFIHGESGKGFNPPNELTISSTAPGNITVSRGGRILLNLNGGKIDKPLINLFSNGPIYDFFKVVQDEFYKEVCTTLGTDSYNKKGSDNSYPARVYVSYLERLIYAIKKMHHGGTIIIVPDKFSGEDLRLKDRVSIKYSSNFNKVWSLLKKDLVFHRNYFDKHFELWDGKEPVSVEDFQNYSIMEDEREDVKEEIHDAVKFVASLSGVDGAVILSNKYRLLGFGGEVIANSSNLHYVSVASDVEGNNLIDIPIESFGTRHRSAFRFCSSYEDSVAIVISQDGGVKAIKRCGQKLILWPDINEGYFGL
jgi:hypothetical protein